VEFVEDGFLVAIGNSYARIDYLDRNILPAASTPNEHATCPGIPARVADEILQNAPQQRRVGVRT
jgi:hypothetical protein